MEEEQELKQHVCKFCSKSFSCGRSLGGHMRSHMINDISAQADGTKLTKKKLPSLTNYNNNGADNNNKNNNTTTISADITGYGLRENPKKTWRIVADHHSSEDTSLVDKSCKECGRVFQSWKALFGHMKCHPSLEKEKVKASNINNSLEEEQQDSWTSANNQKLVMDSQSDNETAAPNRRKRSKRRTRYMGGTANSSSLSFANNINASSSVSEIDQQEQEEVAMCLMMLSRDVGQWGSGLNSVAESSDNSSVFLENNNLVSSRNEVKASVCNGTETLKVKNFGDKKNGKLEDDDLRVESRKSEFSVSGISRKGFTKNDKVKKSPADDERAAENSAVELGKNLSKETDMISSKRNSNKRKYDDSFHPELKSDYLKNSDRSSRFECTTCNKVFHSYQALGGHRASHKKTKGCFASRSDSNENSIETELSPDPTADSKLIIKSIKNEISVDQLAIERDNKAETSYGAKKSKGHECPVCFKVFPSGQALGGHKRSHLLAGTDQGKNDRSISVQESMPPPIRDFLDLNLPAPAEEESNGLVGFNPWWITSNHKHEQLVGLISN
ncbi:putative uncharacterized protein DDB_G0293878 [Ricinus communis]|uniref:C2H2-type domain-containing protein n=1 Tax=Ricinus communis TaxID=3988 RepID=B9RLS0_RICCO|nr:putative uncharacterized protein DDB_G0293878 [Ricinus communis]EEF47795.1 hypothetical protein RCOM_1470470 [Ricinus communis]|eukprot:XP_025012361.1 putative uncharacterized protein DDB_G0293878 [Ricinus communis]